MTKDLTQGRPLDLILGFAVPVLLGMLFQQFYNLVDTMIVGKFLGPDALAAVGSTGSLNFMILGFCSGVCTGFAIPMSQAFGAKEEDALKKYIGSCVWLCILFSVLMAVATGLLCKPILRLMKTPADILEDAYRYIVIIFWGIPATYLYNMLSGMIRAVGDSRTPVLFLAIASVLNIVLDVVLVTVIPMGVAGAALSTLFSRVVAAVFITAMLLKPELPVHLKRSLSLRPDGPMIRRILQVGVPSGLENSMFQLGKILVLSLVASFGTSAIAANAVSNTVSSFQVLAAGAVNLGLIPVVSRCVGAHDFGQARFYTRKLLALAYAATLATNLIVFLILPFILQAYRLSPETAELSRRITLWYGFAAVLTWPMSFTLPNTLRAAGDAVYTMSVSVISMWLCRILLSYVLGRRLGMGVFGTWVAMTIDWQVRIVFFLLRYRGRRWERRHKPASAR